MVAIVEFPATLRIADRAEPHFAQNTRSGGVGLDGGEQVLSPLSGRWEWRAIVPVRSRDQALALRLVKSKLQGRFNLLRIRLCDRYRISRAMVGAVDPVGEVEFEEGGGFDDGSGFALSDPTAPILEAAAAGASEIRVPATALGGAMTAGVFFSINGWLYQVDDWEADGDDLLITPHPALREAVTVDDVADFGANALWVLTADDVGKVDLRGGKFGAAELTLIEPIERRL